LTTEKSRITYLLTYLLTYNKHKLSVKLAESEVQQYSEMFWPKCRWNELTDDEVWLFKERHSRLANRHNWKCV